MRRIILTSAKSGAVGVDIPDSTPPADVIEYDSRLYVHSYRGDCSVYREATFYRIPLTPRPVPASK